MHTLHAILVELDGYDKETILADPNDVEITARRIAMSETECYGEGQVFDWREEDHAGRWSDEYPGNGVVLGAKEPERFMELLNQFSAKPLQEALNALQWAEYSEPSWRTKEQLAADPTLVIIENPKNGTPNRNDVPSYWSGRKNDQPLIDAELIQKIWNGDVDNMLVYYLQKALELANGSYAFDSHFFSVPDDCAELSKKTRELTKTSPEHYALVFSDYHN